MDEENVTIAKLQAEEYFSEQSKPMLAAAREALYRWADAPSSQDLEKLLSLYAADAILVPTVSDEVGGRDEQRRAYFSAFLANPNLKCRIDTLKKRVSAKLSTVVVGGLYTFSHDGEHGERVEIPARYMFTFEKINGEWLITGHHSSRLAEAL